MVDSNFDKLDRFLAEIKFCELKSKLELKCSETSTDNLLMLFRAALYELKRRGVGLV